MSFALLADPTLGADAVGAAQRRVGRGDSGRRCAGCRPTVAKQHLSKLRFAGLVEGQRQGQRVVYRLRGGHVRALLTAALFQPDHHVSGAPYTTSAAIPADCDGALR